MDDIEDCGVNAVGGPGAGAVGGHAQKTVTGRRRKPHERHGEDIPGDASVFVHTFGCGHNVSDGEYMSGILADRGYSVTDKFDNADCFVINSCTVKNPSEDHFSNLVKKAKATGKPVVVAGCVPQGDAKNSSRWKDVSVIGVRSIDRVGEVVEESLRGNTVHAFSENKTDEALPPLKHKKIRKNASIEIIPINVGCLNNCTYCKTKAARGDLKSYPVAEIVGRVQEVVAEGVREIRLTSEDTGAYGLDIGTNIVELLKGICRELEGTSVMLRVGMSNPPYLLKLVDDYARLLNHPNVYAFVHIPIQSGSNVILDAMKREYTQEEFRFCVDRMRTLAPEVSIATDIICAFPGEGESEWADTMTLCRDIKFPVLNISRFYARRNTPAASMPQVPTDVAKRRSVELTNLIDSYRCYDDLVGTIHVVQLLEVAHDKHHLIGHTKGYVQVLVDPKDAKMGETVEVKITSAEKWSCRGAVVAVLPEAAPVRMIDNTAARDAGKPRQALAPQVTSPTSSTASSSIRHHQHSSSGRAPETPVRSPAMRPRSSTLPPLEMDAELQTPVKKEVEEAEVRRGLLIVSGTVLAAAALFVAMRRGTKK